MSDLNSYEESLAIDLAEAEAVIKALTEQLEAARHDADEAEAYAWQLEQRLYKAVEALRNLIQHTHNCEKELTEKLHRQDFCGESLPLTNARAELAKLEGTK
jgi:phytoene/squalene synthetase